MRRNPLLFRRPPPAPVSAPIITGQPQITGIPSAGSPALFDRAPVSGSAPIVATQQWAVGGVDVGGATSAVYVPAAGDVLTVRQTETNAVGVASATSPAVTVVASAGEIQIATYGDSRADLGSVSNGPDLFDGASRSLVGLTNSPTFVGALPVFMRDVVLTANGGRSGETSNGWNSNSRAGGVTITAVKALSWDAIIIQYGINDVSQSVTSTGTRDSVSATVCTNLQALITSLLATGRKVIWQTVYQRSAAGFGANAVVMREAVDYINYGNGSTIQGMTAWITTHASFNTLLYIHDVQSLLNLGGVSTGAYLDTTWASDGTHADYAGARRIAKSMAAKLRTIYADRGIMPMHRAVGPNLIPGATAAYYGNQSVSNCTVGAITYSTDANGRSYGETTITPTGLAGFYHFDLFADVGTNGGRTPLGGAVAVNDFVRPRVRLTIDNGAGGAPVVNNVLLKMFVSYIGGTPGLDQASFSGSGQGTSNHAEADFEAQYMTAPLKLNGDSSLIGAPAAGAGMRFYFQIYFPATTTPFRVRWTAPEIRKVL